MADKIVHLEPVPTWVLEKGDGLGAAADCWICDHYELAIQNLNKPGMLGLCLECSDLLEAGAQVIKAAACVKCGGSLRPLTEHERQTLPLRLRMPDIDWKTAMICSHVICGNVHWKRDKNYQIAKAGR
jgi:hypothetical protein